MRYLLVIMSIMFYAPPTASTGLEDYLYKAWDEESWSCVATAFAEQDCDIDKYIKDEYKFNYK